MSIPAAPKKCFNQLRDNRNGARNNNESILSLGDTNANQIMLEVSSSQGESETHDLVDEIGNANSSGPEQHTHFLKDPHQLQGFGKGPQAASTSLKDFKLSPTIHRELHEEHTMERSTDILQTPRSVQGPSLSSWRAAMGEASLEVLAKRDVEIPRHAPKDKLAKTLDNEELKRHSLERASSSAAAFGSLTLQHQQPAQLDALEPRGHVPGGGEGPQRTLTDYSPGTAFLPADNTSEGKSVRPPKPSTSEVKETSSSETQTEGAHRLNVCNERPSRAAHPEPALNSTLALKEILSYPEAQLGQGKGEPKLELKYVQPRTGQELKSTQAGGLGCLKEESMSHPDRKELHGEAHKEALFVVSTPSHSSHHHPGVGRGGGEEKTGVGAGVDDLLQVTRQGSASLEVAGNLPTGKVSPSTGKKLKEMTSSNFLPSDGHVAFVPNDLTDSKPSDVSEEKKRTGSGNRERTMVLASDPSPRESKTGIPESLNPQSSCLEAGGKETTVPVVENGNLPEDVAKREITPSGAESILNMPAPLHPETTVNLTHQPTPPSSSLQDLGVFSVNAGSPSAVPPTTDSARLFNTSPKVPEKTTCPSGIPKPVVAPSKDTPSSEEGTEKHQVEKTEERTDMKPIIMPKPKHVRPKIITYIRRNPQALGQVDTSLVPVGLPYAPPACSMPLPQEDKVASGDLKPSANLYEKFKPDLQKPRVFSSGLMVSGIKPPGHHFSQISEKFLQEVRECPYDMTCKLCVLKSSMKTFRCLIHCENKISSLSKLPMFVDLHLLKSVLLMGGDHLEKWIVLT